MADSSPPRAEENTKANRHGNGECPILSCDFGKGPGKEKNRHDVFAHLRKKHYITDLPQRPQSAVSFVEHNKACLEHFGKWADEHGVEHEGEKFFKYAIAPVKRNPPKKAKVQAGVAAGGSAVGFPPTQTPHQPENVLPSSVIPAGVAAGGSAFAFPPMRAPYRPENVLPASVIPAGVAAGGSAVGFPPMQALYQPETFLPPSIVPADTPWYGQRRAALLYPESADGEEEENDEEDDDCSAIPDNAEYGIVPEEKPELSHIISQLRAGSRSLTSTLPELRRILDQGLHHQLIDAFVSVLGGRVRVSDLRHDSAYRSLLLALLILHASETSRSGHFPTSLITKIETYRLWLTQQSDLDCPHHLYKLYCGGYRAENGFFDVMYGIYVEVMTRTNIETVPLIDFRSIVTELGGEEEGKHAAAFRDQYRELLIKDYELLKTCLIKAMKAWLEDYSHFNQAFFQHLVFELDAEEEARDRMRRERQVQ
ncbi:uncharacterized protein MYCFIDRAFT_200152 [Pseudocercospora fijiensis CIRAD86]|uniref:Uncharacterized protein n=1 Tax=Pseudocercospora fijiensis (strain CIRAD86) TaxID=383855 RepID=M3AJS0_PSEFD|nr:uncharacterized protein MYCFIDRAFT_200152 [Pseudocercospora fijiensis CIRAD86]EME77707.1 hypothetical protein MYCFIDRAFT_200152 [Pseudocercospora fijiensis CIRAD86]